MAWAKYLGGGLAVLALIFMGWKAAGWRADAMQLEGAKLELRNELQRRAQSDADRLAMQEKLTAAQEALAKRLEKTITTIRSHEPKGPTCDIPDDVAGQLSKLRQGQ